MYDPTVGSTDAAHFQTVAAPRARNRVAFALREAKAALDSALIR